MTATRRRLPERVCWFRAWEVYAGQSKAPRGRGSPKGRSRF